MSASPVPCGPRVRERGAHHECQAPPTPLGHRAAGCSSQSAGVATHLRSGRRSLSAALAGRLRVAPAFGAAVWISLDAVLRAAGPTLLARGSGAPVST